MKKNNKGSGVLFSPEMKEAVKRIKDKEKELDEVLMKAVSKEEQTTTNK